MISVGVRGGLGHNRNHHTQNPPIETGHYRVHIILPLHRTVPLHPRSGEDGGTIIKSSFKKLVQHKRRTIRPPGVTQPKTSSRLFYGFEGPMLINQIHGSAVTAVAEGHILNAVPGEGN